MTAEQWNTRYSQNTLLKPSTLNTIQRSCGRALDWGVDAPDIYEQRLPLPCPPDLVHYFQALTEPREVIKTYLKGEPPIVGTTWLEPLFTLGSANRGEFWNQRRSVVAYWGSPRNPSSLQIRFLRNGYDFADAQLFTAQRRGDLLGAVNFGLDGGNTHISIDRIKEGRFNAEDLRLRFELGGAAAAQRPSAPDKPDAPGHLNFGDLHLHIAAPIAVFGDLRPRWESGQDGERAWLDLVLYAGDARAFDLKKVEAAALGFALRLTGSSDAPPPKPTGSLSDGRLLVVWDRLRVSVPARPAAVSALQRAAAFAEEKR